MVLLYVYVGNVNYANSMPLTMEEILILYQWNSGGQ